jgi:hypothetical protein
MSLGKNNNRSKWKRNNAKLKNQDKLAVYTYPSLHDMVLEALGGTVSPTPYFNEIEDDGTAINKYDTNIVGRFQCSDQNWCVTPSSPQLLLLTVLSHTAASPDGEAGLLPSTSDSSTTTPTTPTSSASAASGATRWGP